MIDSKDTQTLDLFSDLPEKKKRGRPKTGEALSPAEKMQRYRLKKK